MHVQHTSTAPGAHRYITASGGTPVPSGASSATPLVPMAEFSSAPVPGWLRIKADRYALQSVGRAWMPDHRIASCHRRPARRDLPVEVYHHPGGEDREGRACFGMLQTCGSPWADPVCAGAISDYRRGELGHALANHRGGGGSVLLLTYTARHNASTGLSAFLRAMLRAVVAMRKRRDFLALRHRYGHVGSVRATEVTLGRHGWHPHCHEVWFGDAGDIGHLGGEIGRLWLAALQSEGLDGLPGIAADVREASMTVDDYVTKYGKPRKWDVDAELAKAIAKRGHGSSLMPFDLLRLGVVSDDHELVAEARDHYREYVSATKGKSSLHWSPGLRDRLGLCEVGDAEIADGVDALAGLLGHIEHSDWRRIMAADARIPVLAAAATGEWPAVQAVIDGLPTVRPSGMWAAAISQAEATATPAHYDAVYQAELQRMAGN